MDNTVPVKRKRVVVSLEKKLEAIKRLDSGELIKNIALEYGVGPTTVGDWRKNRKEIEGYCNSLISKDSVAARCTLKKPQSEHLDEAVFNWFCLAREQGIPVTGPILQERAIALNNKLKCIDNFEASKGWLFKFKQRHGIRQLSVAGEMSPLSEPSSSRADDTISDHIENENFSPCQIYSADVTSIWYKLLPEKILAPMESEAGGQEETKDRLSALLCFNASGEDKLPLVVIGKCAKSTALKNININSLPVEYQSQKSAMMDAVMFKDWFLRSFVPHVTNFLDKKKLPHKAILVMKKAQYHPDEEKLRVGGIEVFFIPIHKSCAIQALHNTVISIFNRHYKKKFLCELLKPDRLDLISDLKNINYKEILYMAIQSWNSVERGTLNKAWADCPLRLGTSAELKPMNDEELPSNRELMSLLEKIDDKHIISDEDVTYWVAEASVKERFSDEEVITKSLENQDLDEPEISPKTKISHEEGFLVLCKAISYLEGRGDVPATDLIILKKWRDHAALARKSNVKQNIIDDFFSSSTFQNIT